MTSVSARRFAAMKSRLSIIAAVIVRWLTFDPVRGCQCDPVCLAKCSAAWSRKYSMTLRRSINVRPSAMRRFELDGADFGTVLLALAAPLRLLVAVELAFDACRWRGGTEWTVDHRRSSRSGSSLVSRRLTISASKMSATAPAISRPSGRGRGIRFVLERTVAVELQLGDRVVGGR